MNNKEDIKGNCFLKMSMYLFSIFKESIDNDHITAILTCSGRNPLFSKKG